MEIEFLTEEQDQDFKDWHSQHPDGFYLNERGKNKVMLHKVGCWHLQGPGLWPETDDYCSTANFKIASDNCEDLESWAKRKESKLVPCGHCKPG